ncbi:hypothetical protein JZO70_13320 [Enterococcus sp. 669A]|uniref:Esterase n=1 Tax=Candidatus Enterococcus moelleringii TaxID=2815325 RepID=A0ABS3LBY9_9ENTE|nr:alpha/beta hydrolase-fold protein [Enterococcus sp. 669A]MBO1307151.1 hypothetical protein [Enterococcus sp. 669A]
MKRKLIGLATGFVVMIGLVILFLNQQSASEEAATANPTTPSQQNINGSAERKQEELNEGQVGMLETIQYQTEYENTVYDKMAQIYLPAGYKENPNQQYDVLYLMHGHTMDYADFLTDRGTGEASAIKELLDQLIAAGKIEPLIVVSPTYYPDRSVIESSWSADDPLNLRFANEELPNDLIPAVEGTYRTYANSVSAVDLAASREQRAFAGFSMGAITTWYVFEHQLNLFAKFLPMAGDSWTVQSSGGSSAPEETAEKLAQSVRESNFTPDDFQIYASVGGADGTKYSMDEMIYEMWDTDSFTNDNLVYTMDEDGGHDLESVRNQLDGGLRELFGVE